MEYSKYSIRLSQASQRDLDDLPARMLDELASKHFPRISQDPRKVGRPKSGVLSGIWGYDFGPKGGYRILYEIHDKERIVLVIAIGPHDQAYRKASRRR